MMLSKFLRAVILLSIGACAIYSSNAEPLRWVSVSGTSGLAAINTGYLLDSNSNTDLLLPANPPVGGIIQVVGVGGGVWDALADKGQSIQANTGVGSVSGVLGTLGNVSSIASSLDGTRLVACIFGGFVYTSADGGAT